MALPITFSRKQLTFPHSSNGKYRINTKLQVAVRGQSKNNFPPPNNSHFSTFHLLSAHFFWFPTTIKNRKREERKAWHNQLISNGT